MVTPSGFYARRERHAAVCFFLRPRRSLTFLLMLSPDRPSQLPVLIGLDVGTTNVKCLAIDAGGELLATVASPTPVTHPRVGWTDFPPEQIWGVAASAIGRVLQTLGSGRDVVGIAIAGLAESLVPLDENGKAVASAIAWFDLRTGAEFDWIRDQISHERLFQITGLNPDPMYGVCKMLWLRNHAPELFARVRCWLNLAEYVAFRLCGEAATDPSLACRTLLYNLSSAGWDRSLLAELDIDPTVLAAIKPSGTALGRVTAEAQRETSLPASTIVSVGMHDHLGGAFATGSLRPGVLLDSMGTSESLITIMPQPTFAPEVGDCALPQGAVWVDEPRFYLTGGLFTAGAAIEWFRRELAPDTTVYELEKEATEAFEDVPLFLPHLVRSFTPHPDTEAAGAFVGIKSGTTRGALFRGLLEGLAFEAKLVADSMVQIGRAPAFDEFVALGGIQQNALLAQTKADVYGRSIQIHPLREAVGYGAALLAGIGCGVFRNAAAAIAVVPQRTIELFPNAERAARLADLYEQAYCRLYGDLKVVHHTLYRLRREGLPP
jgi:xylulokinase